MSLIQPITRILQRDLKALQVGHTLQLSGDHVKRVLRQTFAAERRSGFLKTFEVYRVAVGADRPEYATRVNRTR